MTDAKVPLSALTPYLGRFVRFILVDGLEYKEHCGFLNIIRSGQFGGQFVLDDHLDPIPQVHVVTAYNIIGKKIAGDGPEIYIRNYKSESET